MPDDVIQIAFEALDKGLSKKIDDIGGKLDQLEGKVDTSAESFRSWDNVLDKSFDDVGTSAADVSRKLESLGAATTDAAKIQHELERAQNDVVASAQKLAEAQQALARNTDPSKHAELRREVSAAQVSLDSAAASVKKYSDEINRMGEATTKSQGGFSRLQAGIVTANQALELVQRGFGYVKDVIEQTVGRTIEYSKQVRDLATNLGITTEETSKIIQASDDYGISVDTVTSALQMAVRKGFAPNIETLARLADEYQSIADPTERAARLTDVFGRNWTALTPMLKEGGQAIRDAAKEAEKLGLVLSDKDVQAARNLEIQVDNLNDRVEALQLKMGKDLVPAVTNGADALNKFADVVQGTESPLDRMIREREYLITLTGRESEWTKRATREIEEYRYELENIAEQERVRNRLLAEAGPLNTAAISSAQKHTEIMREYAKQLLAGVEAYQRTKINLADTTVLAIQYTEAQKQQADVQKQLDDLNAKITSHGAQRVITVKNEKLSAEELARTQLQLAAAQEDLIGAKKKANETDAEFALRVDTLKGKVADYSQKLGEHTAIVGGATKAEIEQKKALEEQIATLQKASEIDKAKAAFQALTAAFQSGALTEGQYQERATALNAVAGLYTEAALKQATAQEILMKSFADPRSETWRGQLLLNQDAIDGQVNKTKELTGATDTAAESLKKLGVIPPVKIEVKAPVIDKAALTHNLDDALKYKPPTIMPVIDTKQAEKDLTNYVLITDKLPKEKKTNFSADTTTATKNTQSLLTLFGLTPAKKSTQFEVKADEALQTYDTLYLSQERLHDKIIDILVRYKTEGEPVSNFQHGVDMIVPPNPRGGTSDYFPFLAAPGERVTVQTKAQQNSTPTLAQSGDTYIYNTNVYNPLAAAMLADKQRRDRLARSNARMGVV